MVGYIGNRDAAPILLDGLKKLEYRGYDSAGVAILNEGAISVEKTKGRPKNLHDMFNGGKKLPGGIGIGHTRGATHGEPSDVNSHPHASESGKIAVVLAIATEGNNMIEECADGVLYIPKTEPLFSPSPAVTLLQLFAYYVASLKGCDIDKPRNLAKSVTVE